jgi:methionyl-tRNA synthetase
MKNLHLVPVNVIDLVEKINDKTIRENEKNNYVLRLEATASYITEALHKNTMTFSHNRKKTAR